MLEAHARQRAAALLEQAKHEQDFADRVARDRLPSERPLRAELRFRVRHLRGLARLWLAFAKRAGGT